MNRVPAALRNRVTVLLSPRSARKIFVLGTAHLSRRSSEDVKQLIHAVQPSDVFVELCGNRTDVLYRDGQDDSFKNGFGPQEMVKVIKNGNLFAAGYAYLLHSLGKELDLTPGAEFRAAYLAAQETRSNVLLGDRDVRTTIFRVWQGLTFMEKGRLLYQVVFQSEELMGAAEDDNNKLLKHIDSMTEGSMDLKAIFDAMDEEFPWVVESLLRERDVHMGILLKRMLRIPHGGDMVAVVGAAHVDGILQEWLTERTVDGEQSLMRVVCSRPIDKKSKQQQQDPQSEGEGEGEGEADVAGFARTELELGVEGFTKADLRHYVNTWQQQQRRAAKEKEKDGNGNGDDKGAGAGGMRTNATRLLAEGNGVLYEKLA